MEVSNVSPLPPTTSSRYAQHFTPSNMDIDMDMDIDIPPEEEGVEVLETEAMRMEAHPSQTLTTTSSPSDDPNQVTAHKIHLRGLDSLHTDDLKHFSSEHFPSEQTPTIEWVDDTSANLVYESADIAINALNAFSSADLPDISALSPLQSRFAKSLSTHPDSKLEVRLAVIGDKKAPRARERSRYYLFHPEHDPGERRRRQGRGRRRSDDRHGENDGDYRRRRYDDREQRRRTDREDRDGFDSSMYDDDAGTLQDHARGDRGRSRELFPERLSKAGRNRRARSASPMIAADESDLMDGIPSKTSGRLRDRSYSPPSRVHRPVSPRRTRESREKELFPGKAEGRDISSELRGNSPDRPPKELFPNRPALSIHRRTDAFDAADDTATIFAGHMTVPFTDGSRDNTGKQRSLADRITKHPQSTASSPAGSDQEDRGFSIRGAAHQPQQDQGFSIRGASGPDAKELFPSKLGTNAGKELFSERLEGRGGRRRKAEDMFY